MEIGSSEVEMAKAFWGRVDVDNAFDALCDYLKYLRETIKGQTATDREYVQGMNIILESKVCFGADEKEIDFFQEMLVGEGCNLKKLERGTEHKGQMDSILSEVDESRNEQNLPSISEDPTLLFQSSSPVPPRSPILSNPEDTLALVLPFAAASPCLLDDGFPKSPHRSQVDCLAPLTPHLPSFGAHSCGTTCLHAPHSAYRFQGHNPLKAPLLLGFHRQRYRRWRKGPGAGKPDVLYKAPCGRSLRCPREVLRYLRETGGEGPLRPDDFSFSAGVLLERRGSLAPRKPPKPALEPDISRGVEPVPVQLCNELDGERPADFRYRKDRWPHGCLVSAAPLFSACCDCTDGCADRSRCACLNLSLRNSGAKSRAEDAGPELYSYGRLLCPVPSGIYECGPWCGCDRGRCQNRLVQRGLHVRLQVFRTLDRGWGVRCRDDLDRGTFICTYAGVLLMAGSGSDRSCFSLMGPTPLPHQGRREAQPSDDEVEVVEVVEEWRLPTEESGASLDPTKAPPAASPPAPPSASSPLHVSLIQSSTMMDGDRDWNEDGSGDGMHEETLPVSGTARSKSSLTQTCQSQCRSHPKNHADGFSDPELGEEKEEGCMWDLQTHLLEGDDAERSGRDSQEHLYYLDSSEEGNVGRFLNHSCCPNLFVQNVFVDSHDPNFPIVAFFTSRLVKAGTELTWNYMYDPGSVPEQEVPCRCGCANCQGSLI